MDTGEPEVNARLRLFLWSCRGCLGEMYIPPPFEPRFCAHCGWPLDFNGSTIAEAG